MGMPFDQAGGAGGMQPAVIGGGGGQPSGCGKGRPDQRGKGDAPKGAKGGKGGFGGADGRIGKGGCGPPGKGAGGNLGGAKGGFGGGPKGAQDGHASGGTRGPPAGGGKGGKGAKGGGGGCGPKGSSFGHDGAKGGKGGKKGDRGDRGGGKGGGKPDGGKAGGWTWVPDGGKSGGYGGGRKGGGYGSKGDSDSFFGRSASFAPVPNEEGDGEYVEWTEYTEGTAPEYEAEALWTNEEQTQDTAVEEVHVYGPHGHEVPGATLTFEDCAGCLSEPLIESLKGAGFTAPTGIQAHTWPIASAGMDVIGVAKTGSGKTLAFLLPGLMKLKQREVESTAPGVLVLAPTRELAQQIEVECQKFGAPHGFKTSCCYGGAQRGPQLTALRAGVSVVVACPGRLNDFIESGQVQLASCNYVVLDEADRMLDMGFEPQIRKIIEKAPKQRQTLLFTATWPKQVRSLASEFLNKPVHVQIGKADALTVNNDISQHVVMVTGDEEKHAKLVELVSQHAEERVLVFTETKRAAEALGKSLAGPPHKFSVVRIHGDMEQHERKHALDSFRAAKANVMVATDVAARGLDVKGITVVVNYDAAWTGKEYVHRIGRTGRAGEKGSAYTLLLPDDGPQAREIMQVMERSGVDVPPELRTLSTQRGRARPGTRGGANGQAWGRNKAWGSSPTGPDLTRQRVGPDLVSGKVLEWRGSFGWIRPDVAVQHPKASKHDGKLYANKKDLCGLGSLEVGAKVRFYVYTDAAGIGAEEVQI